MKNKQLLWVATIACLVLGACEGQAVSKDTLVAVDDLMIIQQMAQPDTDTKPSLEDGLYFAHADTFSDEDGWMSTVSFEVKEGNIINLDLNAINEDGLLTKKDRSTNGDYKMMELGLAQAEWHEQIAIIESYLLLLQSVEELTLNENGSTDSVAGVSIDLTEYVSLFTEALNNGPIERGSYQDGHYYAEASDYIDGYKYYINMYVLNGTILSVEWDGINQEGTSSKKEDSKNGTYGMVSQGNAQSEWYIQADLAEDYLIEYQDPFLITYNENDTTDVISNVSIRVNDFVELTVQALAAGPTIEE